MGRPHEETESRRRYRTVVGKIGLSVFVYALMVVTLIGLVVAGAVGLLFLAGVT